MNENETRNQEVRYYNVNNGPEGNNGKKKSLRKSLFIFAGIIAGILILGFGCKAMFSSSDNSSDISGSGDISGNNVAVLYVEGTIASGDTSVYDDSNYNHTWAMNTIDQLIDNPSNKGLIIFVDSPGGGVYESDELYLKLQEYKATGRPLYSAMGSMAASGGYYISAPAEKIYANRNCWTGSIGVTIGTIYDVSGLLKKHGINSVTITSGKNKAMGGIADPMTKEQKAIFQGLVDESYEQFVNIVAKGRSMSVNQVKKLADGRIYTAKQAKTNGLVDEVGTLEEAIDDMEDKYNLDDCDFVDLKYIPEYSLFDSLFMQFSGLKKGVNGDVSALLEMMNKQGEMPISYMSEVHK